MTHASMTISTVKRKWPWAGAGALVLATMLACGSAGSDTTGAADGPLADTSTTAPKAAKTKAAEKKATPGLNVPVRDGKFEFTVTGVKCGATKVGSDMLGQKAQGQYCMVEVRVKNIGKEAQTFTDSAQKAYDAKDVEYSADSTAGIYVNSDNQTLLQEINPGNAVTGKIVFDVPKGTKLTSLTLHDSVFSGGVQVTLQ